MWKGLEAFLNDMIAILVFDEMERAGHNFLHEFFFNLFIILAFDGFLNNSAPIRVDRQIYNIAP